MNRLVLMALAALLLLPVRPIEAGRRWVPKRGELGCPNPRAPRDTDGCPTGSWGFPDYMAVGPLDDRAQTCAELHRLCAAR